MKRYGVGVTKACAVMMMSRSLYRYESCRRDSGALVMRIHEITHTRVHYGYRRVRVMLRREGYRDNHKRVYRLHREQGLSLRHKRPKRNKSAQRRQPKAVAQAINDTWSMDFVMDQLFDGRFRQECLNSHWFLSFADAKEKIDAWRTYYNEVRPHSALKWQAPAEYARKHLADSQNANLNEPEISTSDPE